MDAADRESACYCPLGLLCPSPFRPCAVCPNGGSLCPTRKVAEVTFSVHSISTLSFDVYACLCMYLRDREEEGVKFSLPASVCKCLQQLGQAEARPQEFKPGLCGAGPQVHSIQACVGQGPKFTQSSPARGRAPSS